MGLAVFAGMRARDPSAEPPARSYAILKSRTAQFRHGLARVHAAFARRRDRGGTAEERRDFGQGLPGAGPASPGRRRELSPRRRCAVQDVWRRHLSVQRLR